MKGDDYAEGIYWIMRAIAHREGVGYDASAGIEYHNDVFESFNFWNHCECDCAQSMWEWDVDDQVAERMKAYPDVEKWGPEWNRLYQMELKNVTQGSKGPGHSDECSLREYNFKHFASGLEIEWYKRVGRSTKSNLSLTALDWYKIVVECIESVRDHDYRGVFGSVPEAWRDPLGALILTLAGDPDEVDVRRAQVECRELTRVLNEK